MGSRGENSPKTTFKCFHSSIFKQWKDRREEMMDQRNFSLSECQKFHAPINPTTVQKE